MIDVWELVELVNEFHVDSKLVAGGPDDELLCALIGWAVTSGKVNGGNS